MDNAPQIFTPTFTGQWEDKPYEPLSIVVNNGNTYVSKKDVPVGTLLTNTTYWLDLSTYYSQLFTDYETAEQERQQAEAIRIENENQRKTDHVNRSAELASKADKVVINNLIRNGDFSNGTTGWSDYGSKIAVEDSKRLKVINNGGASYAQVWRYIDLAPMSKYYFRAKIEDGNKNTNATLVDWFSGGVKSSEGLYELLKENTSEEIVRRQLKFSNVSTLGDYYYISDIQLINLTATFGAGKEPTREEMGELIKLTGYIDGEYALNNKEMLIWTLALIRRNKNAIVTLGGA